MVRPLAFRCKQGFMLHLRQEPRVRTNRTAQAMDFGIRAMRCADFICFNIQLGYRCAFVPKDSIHFFEWYALCLGV